MSNKSVAVIIPTLNEERHIRDVLHSFKECWSNYIIVVVDGGSTDKTREIVENEAIEDSRIKLILNPKRIQSSAINLAAKELSGSVDYIIRADAHCQYNKYFVRNIMEKLQIEKIDSVVVPMETIGTTPFQKALAALQNSKLGNGGSAHRTKSSGNPGKLVDHGHHAGFKLKTFNEIGGYDETFTHNEDAELDIRLNKAGKNVWLEPTAEIGYHPRGNIESLAKQYFKYGRGRARTAMKHPGSLKIRQMLPIGILLSCLIGFMLSIINPIFLIIPLGYMALCLSGGVALAIRERDISIAAAGPAAIVMHISWATGFLMQRFIRRFTNRFQTRSRDRDLTNDQARIDSIIKVSLAALNSAESEKNGLSRRLRESEQRATFLMGNEVIPEREEDSEFALKREEDQMSYARERLTDLDAHIDHLKGIIEQAQVSSNRPSIDF